MELKAPHIREIYVKEFQRRLQGNLRPYEVYAYHDLLNIYLYEGRLSPDEHLQLKEQLNGTNRRVYDLWGEDPAS